MKTQIPIGESVKSKIVKIRKRIEKAQDEIKKFRLNIIIVFLKSDIGWNKPGTNKTEGVCGLYSRGAEVVSQ